KYIAGDVSLASDEGRKIIEFESFLEIGAETH
ncbi:MAG: hypothetical protein US58_C0021G0001, partial [Candidatus Magasanikbacteria bacterium GW2011_GWA2_37_8]